MPQSSEYRNSPDGTDLHTDQWNVTEFSGIGGDLHNYFIFILHFFYNLRPNMEI